MSCSMLEVLTGCKHELGRHLYGVHEASLQDGIL